MLATHRDPGAVAGGREAVGREGGALLYPTRAVDRMSSHSVARLTAQLIAGLGERGVRMILFQASPPTGDAGTPLIRRVKGGTAARGVVHLLKRLGLPAAGGRLRLRDWYARVAAALPSDLRFTIVCQAAGVAPIRSRWPHLPIILWLHDIPRGEAAAAWRSLDQADAVVVASRAMRDGIWEARRRHGISPALWVVPLPVEPLFVPAGPEERQARRRELELASDDRPILGFASHLHPHKGLQTVLAALAGLRHEGWTPTPLLLVAGDAQEETTRRAAAAGVELAFTGRLPPDRLRHFYVAVDLVLVPSAWEEPYGLVAAEALACGTPVLASAAGGLVEVCRGQPHARLVEPASPAAWSEAIRQAVAAPPRRPSSLGVEGGEDAFLDAWERLLAHHVPGAA